MRLRVHGALQWTSIQFRVCGRLQNKKRQDCLQYTQSLLTSYHIPKHRLLSASCWDKIQLVDQLVLVDKLGEIWTHMLDVGTAVFSSFIINWHNQELRFSCVCYCVTKNIFHLLSQHNSTSLTRSAVLFSLSQILQLWNMVVTQHFCVLHTLNHYPWLYLLLPPHFSSVSKCEIHLGTENNQQTVNM